MLSSCSIRRSFGYVSFVVSFFLVLAISNPALATAPVGATAGSFSVDSNGGANYTIPIAAPPGTAGMVPKIALTYTKAIDNPLVGLGFSISGLSVINRCGRTIALDGVKGGVNYDSNDRLCLDGQRLIAITSTACGTNGSEYRTEHEGFSRVCAYRDSGFTGSGPQYFKVMLKGGTLMEYGVTADSRIEASPKNGVAQATVRLWALNKVQDTTGNYYTVTYNENNANGEYSPARIDYTGNINTGLTPYNSIRFTYAARPDIVPRYEGGSQIKLTQRLTKLESYTDNSVVRTYNVSYDSSGSGNASRLTSIQECGSDGVCFNPTTIGWDQPSTGFPRVTTHWTQPDTGWGGGWQLQMADVNGDGKSDLIWNGLGTNNWISVALSNGDGSFTRLPDANVPGTGWGSCQMFIADINGDGKSDLVWNCLGSDYNSVYIALANGNGTFAPAVYSSYAGTGWSTCRLLIADVDGDGRSDLLWSCLGTNNNTIIYRSIGDGTFAPLVTQWVQPETGWGSCVTFIADIDGDGKSDLIWNCLGTLNQTYAAVSNGDGTFTRVMTAWAQPESGWGSCHMQTADINGDGKSDLVWYCLTASLNRTYISLSNGDGSFTRVTTAWDQPGTGWASYRLLIADINGDGKSDLVWSNPSTTSNRTYVALSNGDGSFAPVIATWEPETGWSGFQLQVADINGDGKSDLIWNQLSTYNTTYADLSAYNDPNKLAAVTTGLGATTNVTYKPITDSSVYTKDSGSVYPYQEVQVPTYVVSRITQSDGVGGLQGTSYQYGGAKVHLTGPGWLGFRWRRATDELSNIVTTDYLNQTYNGTEGAPNYTQVNVGGVNGQIVGLQNYFWSAVDLGGGRRFARLDGTLDQSNELNGTQISCTSVDYTYDSFSNVTQSISKTDTVCNSPTAFTTTTNNTYTNDTTRWILGQLTQVQVTSHVPGQTDLDLTRTSTLTHDATTGLINAESIEPGNNALTLSTSYSYNGFGNRISSTVSGPNVTSRGSTTTYDSRGRFAISVTNALGQSPASPATYDPKWGAPLTVTDFNGISVSYGYDGFGRKLSETRADSTSSSITYAACDSSCPALAVYKVTTQSSGSAPTTVYFDLLGRTLRTQRVGLTGTVVYQDTQYDNQGRVTQGSLPYFTGGTIRWNVPTYDTLGRVTVLTGADGGVATNTYAGLSTTIQQSGTGITLRSRTSVTNVVGQVVSVADSLYPSQSTTYQYDVLGNLTKVIDPLGNQTAMVYDLRGRKTQMSDPNMGTWNYNYNALGELTSQIDAKSQTQTATYDLLGRLKTRTTLEGTSTWTYDTATKGIGKLASVSGLNGYQTSVTYDTLGRPSSNTVTIDATSYTTTTSYNTLGQIDTTTYPSTGFAVKRVYNANGYLTELRNAQTNLRYWLANQDDALGHMTSETLGNNLTAASTYDPTNGSLQTLVTSGTPGVAQNESFTFDILGNLLSRTDNIQHLTESFSYDTLNRVTAVTGPSSKTYQYNAIGNLTYKSDVGTYTYNASGTGGVRPHAVASTSGTLNASYNYDANGNLLTGAGRTLTWTSFNKPAQITSGGVTASLTYDPAFNRVKKVTPTSTTIYLGGLYQRVTSGGLIEHKHFVSAGRTLVVYTQRSTNVNDTRYLHTDHLGSVDTITDENGTVVQRLSTDAHGKRRNSNWTDATAPISAQTSIGYTGHEMDDEAGLINMNAREYDPVLGRFMSPDTLIISAVGQGLNRYSYTDNNPLSRVDPSGHSWLSKAKNRLDHKRDQMMHSSQGDMFKKFLGHGFDPGTAALEAFVLKPHQDGFLMRHPGYQPWVKVIVDAIIIYYTDSYEAAAGFNAEFDQHMCELSGGSGSACFKVGVRSFATSYISGSVSAYANGLGSVNVNTGAIDWGAAATEVAVKGVAGGVISEINGGSFSDGFRSGAVMAVLDIAGRAMRGYEKARSAKSNDMGESVGMGDGAKLAGCRGGSTGICMGGFQNGQGFLIAFVEQDYNGNSFITSAILPYSPGGVFDRILEAFSGPHDFFNDMMDAYDSLGNGTNNMFGGEFMSGVNVGLALPFAVVNGISRYAPTAAIPFATGR
jgi:RHS repeat-associated protein